MIHLASPADRALASVAEFALLLAALRADHPRVHYTAPCFAAFCRGEPLEREAVITLLDELVALRATLAVLEPARVPALEASVDPADPEVYRRAHYRGRTFDRTRTIRGVDGAVDRRARSIDLLDAIASAGRAALATGAPLQQRPAPFHRPPEPLERG